MISRLRIISIQKNLYFIFSVCIDFELKCQNKRRFIPHYKRRQYMKNSDNNFTS